jgi:uncharacterized protein (TIGR03437 family)
MQRRIWNLILLLCFVAPTLALAQSSVNVQGFVQALPEAGTLGDWVIGAQLVTVSAATEVDADADELLLGACLEAEGTLTPAGALEAERIAAKDAGDCGGVSQNPGAQKVEFTALVSAAPDAGLVGSWTVGDWTVASDTFTDFDGDEEGFQAGACIEVEGVLLANGVVRASEMKVEDADDCGAAAAGQTAELRGVVDAVPASGNVGDWMVRGLIVRVSDTTEVDNEAGPAEAGACVSAEGGLDASGALLATEVRVLEEERCAAPDESGVEFTGEIETTPDNGLAGSWTVMGVSVTVNSSTELELELGPAQPGVCVQVEGSVAAGTVTARQIRVLGLDCGAPAAGETISFQGQVQSIPPEDTAGVWRISGRTVLVDDSTTVELDGRDPETGLCVEVEGSVIAAGVVGASRLTLLSEACAASPGPPELTQILGVIDSLPPGADLGQWVVGGTDVTVSAATELNADSGDFLAGACVRVEGRQLPNGNVLAREVATRPAADCGEDGNLVEFAGIVTAKPADGQVGDWTISTQQIAVSEDTELDTTDGPLRLGACVEVSGTAQDDGSIAASRIDVESASGACLLAVVSAGSFASGPVSPGEIVSIFGLGMGPGGGLGLVVDGNHVTNSLGSVRVLFDGEPAPILFLSGNQVNVVAPYSLEGKTTTTVQIVWAGAFTKTLELEVAAADPALLTLEQMGTGQAAVLNWEADTQTYTVNGADNPAAPGQAVVFFATGEGQTNPPGDDGAVVDINNLPRPNLPVSVTIGGVPAEAFYAGGAPTLVSGVLQVNAFVPQGLTETGDLEVIVQVGEFTSPPGVTINVQ